MKTKIIILLTSIILISISILFIFFSSKEETQAKEYKIKADNYLKSGNELSKQTSNIEKEVIKKQFLYEEGMAKIETSLKHLEKHRIKNQDLIDSNKVLQKKLLEEYCNDMKELGQFNIELCKN
ncbi:MAG: hypothetical protein H7329_04900 [Opitutaceae bacterium]|nr:hypothetical protein [Cytophagales bacterium]